MQRVLLSVHKQVQRAFPVFVVVSLGKAEVPPQNNLPH